MSQSYKEQKEQFVSNLSGGTVSEINAVTAVAPAAFLLWSALQSRHGYFHCYGSPAFLTDFFLNVAAILLATTLNSKDPNFLNLAFVSLTCLLYLLPPASVPQRQSSKQKSSIKQGNNRSTELDPLPNRPFVTSYRGSMMIITCLAILAVDFKIFPRRFAKVETWGTSLMDMGVGSFVFAAGLVSTRPILKGQLLGKGGSRESPLKTSMKHSIPLLILGVVRLYSVKGLDYAEHVSEYGVHWNFFFTLGFLPPAVALFQSMPDIIPSTALLAMILSTCYQIVLETTSLKSYIFTAARMDLFSQNREGVFSLTGYTSIFLVGQALGFDILPRQYTGGFLFSANALHRRNRVHTKLLLWSAIWVSLYSLVTASKYGFGFQVSRRLANLPYVLWVSAFNCAQITLFCLIETICFPGISRAADKLAETFETDQATSRVLRAFNRNGLAVFLLANILTGLINLSMDTLNMEWPSAMAVLVIYAGLLTAFVVTLDSRNISIKL